MAWRRGVGSYSMSEGHVALAAWLCRAYEESPKTPGAPSLGALKVFIHDLNEVVHKMEPKADLLRQAYDLYRWMPRPTPGSYRRPRMEFRRAMAVLSRNEVPVASWDKVLPHKDPS